MRKCWASFLICLLGVVAFAQSPTPHWTIPTGYRSFFARDLQGTYILTRDAQRYDTASWTKTSGVGPVTYERCAWFNADGSRAYYLADGSITVYVKSIARATGMVKPSLTPLATTIVVDQDTKIYLANVTGSRTNVFVYRTSDWKTESTFSLAGQVELVDFLDGTQELLGMRDGQPVRITLGDIPTSHDLAPTLPRLTQYRYHRLSKTYIGIDEGGQIWRIPVSQPESAQLVGQSPAGLGLVDLSVSGREALFHHKNTYQVFDLDRGQGGPLRREPRNITAILFGDEAGEVVVAYGDASVRLTSQVETYVEQGNQRIPLTYRRLTVEDSLLSNHVLSSSKSRSIVLAEQSFQPGIWRFLSLSDGTELGEIDDPNLEASTTNVHDLENTVTIDTFSPNLRRVFDADNGRFLRQEPSPLKGKFSPSGRFYAQTKPHPNVGFIAEVYDVATNSVIFTEFSLGAREVAWAPAGNKVLFYGQSGGYNLTDHLLGFDADTLARPQFDSFFTAANIKGSIQFSGDGRFALAYMYYDLSFPWWGYVFIDLSSSPWNTRLYKSDLPASLDVEGPIHFRAGYHGVWAYDPIQQKDLAYKQVWNRPVLEVGFVKNGQWIVSTEGRNDFEQEAYGAIRNPLSRYGFTVRSTVQLQDFVGDLSALELTTFAGDKFVQQAPKSTGAMGAEFDGVLRGEYDLFVKTKTSLSRRVGRTAVGTTLVELPPVTLINGDVNGNDEIDLGDSLQLAQAFGSLPGDSNWDPASDLDGDGEVTIFDYIIVSTNFGLIGDRRG